MQCWKEAKILSRKTIFWWTHNWTFSHQTMPLHRGTGVISKDDGFFHSGQKLTCLFLWQSLLFSRSCHRGRQVRFWPDVQLLHSERIRQTQSDSCSLSYQRSPESIMTFAAVSWRTSAAEAPESHSKFWRLQCFMAHLKLSLHNAKL